MWSQGEHEPRVAGRHARLTAARPDAQHTQLRSAVHQRNIQESRSRRHPIVANSRPVTSRTAAHDAPAAVATASSIDATGSSLAIFKTCTDAVDERQRIGPLTEHQPVNQQT